MRTEQTWKTGKGETTQKVTFSHSVGPSRPIVAWMPDERSPAHNILGREVRSGIAPLRRNYLLAKICEEIDRPIKWSGRALYDDGQMINSNVIHHVIKERLV